MKPVFALVALSLAALAACGAAKQEAASLVAAVDRFLQEDPRFERDGAVSARTVETIQRTLEKAGVIFIDANDGGPGVRLRKG